MTFRRSTLYTPMWYQDVQLVYSLVSKSKTVQNELFQNDINFWSFNKRYQLGRKSKFETIKKGKIRVSQKSKY